MQRRPILCACQSCAARWDRCWGGLPGCPCQILPYRSVSPLQRAACEQSMYLAHLHLLPMACLGSAAACHRLWSIARTLAAAITSGVCCIPTLVSASCMPALVQALLGGGASVVLEGQRVIPSRTQDAGFHFQYSHVNQAIANIFR